jgi:hypothetical protein
MKTCTKCQSTKPLDGFYKRWRSPDGLEAWCKVCRLEHNRKWFDKNKDRHGELTRSWYERNKDQHLENSRAWYSANRHRKLATTAKREERCKLATPKWIDMEEIHAVYAGARRMTERFGVLFEVDHIIPLQGKKVSGLNVPGNLQVLARSENRRKFNKLTLADAWVG